MLKKLVSLVAMVIAVSVAMPAATGDWRVHPYYVDANISNVIDTDNKVYFLVGNDVFCFDKATQTIEAFNKRANLNDVLATNIYYNHDKDYLVVTYLNSNIDVIDHDGNVTNLPDIKDVVLTGLKGINDVTFAPGRMYVATRFGMVVYDDETMDVVEARLFNTNFTSAAQIGDCVLVAYDNHVYAAKAATNRETVATYKKVSGIRSSANAKILPVGDRRFIVNGSAGVLAYTLSVTAAGAFSVTNIDTLATTRATTVQQIPGGYIASFKTGSYYVRADANASNPQRVAASKEIFSASPGGNGTLWALGANGLHQDGSTNYYKPNGIGIKVGAFYMVFNKEKNRVYLSTTSDNMMAEWGSNLGSVTQIFTFDGSQWQDVTPADIPGNGVSANWQLVMDPMDPDTYVYPSRKYGVFKITNDKYVYRYFTSNAYYATDYYKGACAFDSQGNLWVCYSSIQASAGTTNLAVLPRAKYEKATCAKSDWILVDVPATRQKAFKGSSFVIGKDDVKVYNGGGYQSSFVFWNETNGLGSTPRIASFNSLTDTEGSSITWTYARCMEKDQDGIVWAGLNNGVVAFDPSRAFDDDFTVMHPQVVRNDGTGLSDILLDGLEVNSISVDAQNCKWIGTNSSGLYQVSPDGTRILKQFTTDNSYLPTNTIYAVCCNTNTNSVYVLTPNGFLEYMSDASPSAQNYDNVYAYPNPVRPDFTGLLTISELMDNSYLTITDATGKTVKQMRSTGGTATWDCCDTSGERMPTGIYSVYASQKNNDKNAKKVTEFLIIK